MKSLRFLTLAATTLAAVVQHHGINAAAGSGDPAQRLQVEPHDARDATLVTEQLGREEEKIRMPFGHYKDSTLGEIAAADVLYLDWLVGQRLADGYLAEAVGVLIEKHAAAIAQKVAAGERPKLFAQAGAGDGRPRPKQMRLFQ